MSIVSIAGHLGRDADFRQGATEAQDVLNFSVAENSGEKDKNGEPLPPVWYKCAIWGKRAGALSRYLLKGTAVTVWGKLRPREYDGRDGQRRTSLDVMVIEITLQGSRAQNQASGAHYSAPQTAQQPAPQPTPAQVSYQQTAAVWGAPVQPTYASVKGHGMKSPTPAQVGAKTSFGASQSASFGAANNYSPAPAQSAPAGVFVPQAAPAPAPQTEAPAPAGFDNFSDDDIPF